MNQVHRRPVRATERFIPQRMLRALLDLEATRTTEDVWQVLLGIAGDLGMSVLDYVYATDFRNWERAQFIRTTFDSSWLDRIRQYPHIRQTSNFRMHGCRHLTPMLVGSVYLKDYGEMSEDKRRHILLSAEMGLEAGVAFPLRMGDPNQAALLAWGGRFSRKEFDAILRDEAWTLHAVSLTAHARYTELFKAEFIERNELTEKQKELIQLVGRGLMDKQIAHALGVSFSAVRQRLASVQQKTGTQNRAELAALAMRLGLVADPLLRDHEEDMTVFLSMGDGETGRELRRKPAVDQG